ncbi:signal peptidase I [Alkalimarinus alittae]|uniref:Signal peptidase I n=1 Tax=Alkalimarinus alittae TaxID=2961619 RepID=A0ABY6MZG2_9ALTE|nr:signal peptidase I [Alkalimarinus alittae]UZE95228.1 signal peptidase I [Alkalimarinus alittae]
MDLDFPLILVVLTFVTGAIWGLDRLIWYPRRKEAADKAPIGEQGSVAAVANQTDAETDEPWLVEMSRSFFPVLAIVLVLRSFLVEPFQIPSGSMLPTLLVGDFILVNKFSYGVRLPVAGTKVLEVGDPQRGDVMVFRYPVDQKTNYIKRVVGVPGDIISYRNKTLYINNKKIEETHVANLPPMQLFEEQLGAVSHQIYKTSRTRPGQGEGEWEIPQGHYFMMGDNRDNSNDSRYWGLVPDEMVVGKAFAIWMHWKSLTSLPSFSRVGSID